MSPGRRLVRVIRRFLVADGDVVGRSVTSGAWVSIYNVVDRLLQLATVLFLAQRLAPTAFGLLGIVLVVQSGLERLTKLGLNTALIRHDDDDVDAYLDTVWTVELARGFLLGSVLYLSAPLVSSFFGEPRVADMLRVFAAFPVLDGLKNPGVVYLVKDLDFRRDVALKLSSRLTYVIVGVGISYVIQSVWALVFAMGAARVTGSVGSYLVHPYRPSLWFDRADASELFAYGKWIFTSEGLMFLINEGDDAFVGWALGSAALGVYQLSYRLSNAPATEITHPIQRVVFPAYSKVKDDVGVLRDGYFTSIRLITLLAFPASVGIALVAPVFVPAVLDSQWTGMIVPMQVLAVYAAVRSFRSATVPLFRAIDRPDYDTKIRVLKLVLLASAIYPASEAFGVTGVALALLGHTLVVAPIASYVAVRSVDGRMWTFARILSYPTFGSAVMGVAVYGVRRQLTGIHPVVELVVLVVVGALVYAGVILLLERQIGIGLDRIYRVVRKQAG